MAFRFHQPNYMVTNILKVREVITDKLTEKGWQLNQFNYDENDCNPYGKKDGPGIICKLLINNSPADFWYPLKDFPSYGQFLEGLDCDVAIFSVLSRYPELNIVGDISTANELYFKNPNNNKQLLIVPLNCCYDQKTGQFNIDHYLEAANAKLREQPVTRGSGVEKLSKQDNTPSSLQASLFLKDSLQPKP